MAELSSTKLNPESHLLLDQPLLRLPYESSRSNFKTAQRHIEQAQTKVDELVKASVKSASANDAGAKSIASLNQAITRLETLKRKLKALDDNQQELSSQAEARTNHLQELYAIPTLADVKYEQWSRVRLDRLLVDYMLRRGYVESAKQLAAERDIDALADIAEFESVIKIERSLRVEHRVDLALLWCGENKQNLKKFADNHFERELRLQQFIELVRLGDSAKLVEAAAHARKYLMTTGSRFGFRWAALLCYDSNTDIEPFAGFYANERWDRLADMFLHTHHSLFSIPHRPLLHIALTAGLSALKTPACHSEFISPTSGLNSSRSPPQVDMPTGDGIAAMQNSHSHSLSMDESTSVVAPVAALINTPVCPICSTELNKLAEPLPYAHHSKSHVENDPVVLPNGRIYGSERLSKLNEKLGTQKGMVRDPSEPSKMFSEQLVRKVYIM